MSKNVKDHFELCFTPSTYIALQPLSYAHTVQFALCATAVLYMHFCEIVHMV